MAEKQSSFFRNYLGVLVLFTIVINMIMFMKIIPYAGFIPTEQGTLIIPQHTLLRENNIQPNRASNNTKKEFNAAISVQEKNGTDNNKHASEIISALNKTIVPKNNLKIPGRDDRKMKAIEGIMARHNPELGVTYNMYGDTYKAQALENDMLSIKESRKGEFPRTALLTGNTNKTKAGVNENYDMHPVDKINQGHNSLRHRQDDIGNQNQPKHHQDGDQFKVHDKANSEQLQGFNADYIRNFWKQRNKQATKEIDSKQNHNVPATRRVKPPYKSARATNNNYKPKGTSKTTARNAFKSEMLNLFNEQPMQTHHTDIELLQGNFDVGNNLRKTMSSNYIVPVVKNGSKGRQDLKLNNPLSSDVKYHKKQEAQRHSTTKVSDVQISSNYQNRSLVTVFPPRGQLGNQIFQLASLLGVAESQNSTPFLSRTGFILHTIFNLPDSIYMNINISAFHHFTDDNDTTGASIELSKLLDTQKNWLLDGYFQSYKYFWHIPKKVRFYLTIKKIFVQAATRFVQQTVPTGHLKVAIHVRRTDFISLYQMKLGRVPVPPGYIYRAMKHFEAQYPNITFLVVSDDIRWCQENIKSSNVQYSFTHHPGIDLAIMSISDHVIITVGTFGWWGAWLSGGTVVYYKNYPRPGSELGKIFHVENYYPESWIGLE